MNKQLHRLLKIAEKKERIIIGLMSGTSLDGLDIALCKCSNASINVERFSTVDYSPKQRNTLLELRSKATIAMPLLCEFNTTMAHFYAEMILSSIDEWGLNPQEVDLIASHGQTIYHLPNNEIPSTFQCVDGDHIAQKTGIPTLSDFRQKHTAVGGEGAPLAKFLDEFLYQHAKRTRVALNLGGIANLTIIPSAESKSEVISTDIGPANTLINEAMHKYFAAPFDEDGRVASQGDIHSELVKYILLEPFFRKDFPKTTGQEVFNLQLIESLMESYGINLNPTDLVASLTELTVKSIVRAIDALLAGSPFDMIVSGGGIHNQTLMKALKQQIPQADFMDAIAFGIPGDAKEAALMAYLGNKWFEENGFEIGNEKSIHLGKLSLPD